MELWLINNMWTVLKKLICARRGLVGTLAKNTRLRIKPPEELKGKHESWNWICWLSSSTVCGLLTEINFSSMASSLARHWCITDGSWNHTDIVDYWSTNERSNDPALLCWTSSFNLLKNHKNNEAMDQINAGQKPREDVFLRYLKVSDE